jgi:EmrB/QacA subfamily drug resistance transporter
MYSYLVFATVSLGLVLAGISSTAVSVAFPVMTSSFDASLVQAGWILSINQLASIITMPLAGKAADMFGKKLMIMISLLLFASGSVLCAIAPNIWFLIAFRFIQGMGTGSMFPVAMGIVADVFPNKRAQFVGLISSISPIGQIIGPNLGGWLVTAFGWRSIFWFNVAPALLALALVIFLIKSRPGTGGHVDLLGIGLLSGSLFGILIGLSQLGTSHGRSEGSWETAVVFILAGVVLMIILLRTISKAKEPIVDWEVLSGKPFLASNIYNFILGACYFGITSFVPLYAVSLYGLSTSESGLIMTPWSVGVLVASAATSFFLVRWGYRKPMIIGAVLTMAGLCLLALELGSIHLLGIQLSIKALIMIATFLLGVGIGAALPSSNNACIELMPDRVASISGVRAMFRNIGGTFSIAIITLVLNNIGNINNGFTIAYFSLTGITLLSIAFVFRMPSGIAEPPGLKLGKT